MTSALHSKLADAASWSEPKLVRRSTRSKVELVGILQAQPRGPRGELSGCGKSWKGGMRQKADGSRGGPVLVGAEQPGMGLVHPHTNKAREIMVGGSRGVLAVFPRERAAQVHRQPLPSGVFPSGSVGIILQQANEPGSSEGSLAHEAPRADKLAV